jgi:hypothetical protein
MPSVPRGQEHGLTANTTKSGRIKVKNDSPLAGGTGAAPKPKQVMNFFR